MYSEYHIQRKNFLTKLHNYHVTLINNLPYKKNNLIVEDYLGKNKWIFDLYLNRNYDNKQINFDKTIKELDRLSKIRKLDKIPISILYYLNLFNKTSFKFISEILDKKIKKFIEIEPLFQYSEYKRYILSQFKNEKNKLMRLIYNIIGDKNITNKYIYENIAIFIYDLYFNNNILIKNKQIKLNEIFHLSIIINKQLDKYWFYTKDLNKIKNTFNYKSFDNLIIDIKENLITENITFGYTIPDFDNIIYCNCEYLLEQKEKLSENDQKYCDKFGLIINYIINIIKTSNYKSLFETLIYDYTKINHKILKDLIRENFDSILEDNNEYIFEFTEKLLKFIIKKSIPKKRLNFYIDLYIIVYKNKINELEPKIINLYKNKIKDLIISHKLLDNLYF